MSNSETQRVPCTKCGAMVLPITAQLYNGLCAKCHREEVWAEEAKVGAAAEAPPPPPLPPITIRTDAGEFDNWQLHLIREIVKAIKSDLADSGIPEERLADVTGDVAFSIASIIDGSRVMQADGRHLIPMLTFAEDDQRTKLVVRPGGSFMHEYVHSTVDDVFDEEEGYSLS